jgi:hypothetical protein
MQFKGTSQGETFDGFLQTLNHHDPNGSMRKCFDILKGDDQSIIHPYHFIFFICICGCRKDDNFPIIAAIQWLLLLFINLVNFMEASW